PITITKSLRKVRLFRRSLCISVLFGLFRRISVWRVSTVWQAPLEVLKKSSPILGLGQVWLFFSRGRRHTSSLRDWSSDVCSSDLMKSLVTARLPPHETWGQEAAAADCGAPAVTSAQAISAHLDNQRPGASLAACEGTTDYPVGR